MEVEKLFEIAGKYFKLPEQRIVKSLDDANIKKFPVVLKVADRIGEHKSEKGLVRIAYNIDEAMAFFKRFKNRRILVQEFVRGVELLVGVKKDETFGDIILLGIGGIYTELFRDFSIRLCPVSKREVYSMIHDLRNKDMILGYRNVKVNVEKLCARVSRFSRVLEEYRIKEIEVNPLICNERDCYAVDVRCVE